MNTRALNHSLRYCWLALVLAAWPAVSSAQVAVAEIEEMEELPTASAEELAELVGPIALYPDDLLAVVLPASTFPLQIVEAARFLEALESDPSLEPDEDWDDSVVALTNYPEVVELLNEDLDWTWRLGEAVVAQQADVISAIELFRDRAYAAGNLKSDEYQVVANEGGTIQITPVEEDVIYVPYYEPERVVVYQPRPVYYYYPRAYPVYYYPYPEYHAFHHNYFWGVTTAFAIGWHSHHLNVFHHSYFGHPYYGRNYWNRWWYRRPDIHVYNNVYVRHNNRGYYDRYRRGDRWLPNVRRTVRSSDQRVTRTRYYPNRDTQSSRKRNSFAGSNSTPKVSRDIDSRRDRVSRDVDSHGDRVSRDIDSRRDRGRDIRQDTRRPEIQFRDRSGTPSADRNDQSRSGTAKFRRETRDRAQVAPRNSSRATPVRPSTQPRRTENRQTQRKQVQPKQTFVRESQVREVKRRESRAGFAPARQSQPRQTQRRAAPQQQSRPKTTNQRQSQPRQTQRRAAPQQQSRPKTTSQRQSQPAVAQSRQSAPRPSNAQSNRSRSSERVARSSQSRSSKSRSSSRRDH